MLFLTTLMTVVLIAILPIQLATASPLSLNGTANDFDLTETPHTTSFLIPTFTTTSVLNLTQPRNE